jgi:hypothetical protein
MQTKPTHRTSLATWLKYCGLTGIIIGSCLLILAGRVVHLHNKFTASAYGTSGIPYEQKRYPVYMATTKLLGWTKDSNGDLTPLKSCSNIGDNFTAYRLRGISELQTAGYITIIFGSVCLITGWIRTRKKHKKPTQ